MMKPGPSAQKSIDAAMKVLRAGQYWELSNQTHQIVNFNLRLGLVITYNFTTSRHDRICAAWLVEKGIKKHGV